jgi:N-glycosylase/DNA lyase
MSPATAAFSAAFKSVNAAACVNPALANGCERAFTVHDYNLAATLNSGQTFRWQPHGAGWVGVVGSHWVRLEAAGPVLTARTARPVTDWSWLAHYLQVDVNLGEVLASFPDDEPLRSAIGACRGLRLLRQDPWECLASFILSSTKQIVQIRQIISHLCERHGEPLPVPEGHSPARSFPSPARLADIGEAELRRCKMGFRAPYLRETARLVTTGQCDPARIHEMSLPEARAELLKLPGVGPKIADCVLLFGFGFAAAFPVDVWVMRALRQLYFPRRRPSRSRLQHFTNTHFGPHAGYAQQYLFHHIRTGGLAAPKLPPEGGRGAVQKKPRE